MKYGTMLDLFENGAVCKNLFDNTVYTHEIDSQKTLKEIHESYFDHFKKEKNKQWKIIEFPLISLNFSKEEEKFLIDFFNEDNNIFLFYIPELSDIIYKLQDSCWRRDTQEICILMRKIISLSKYLINF